MLSRLRFKYLILLSPAVATVAFVCIAFAILVVGRQNEEQLTQIRSAYLPAREASRELELVIDETQRAFQDAAAASDEATLARAQELRRRFQSETQRLKATRLRKEGDIDSLARDFEHYFQLGYKTTQGMIRGGLSEHTVKDLETVQEQYASIRERLEDSTKRDASTMQDAFNSAIEVNKSSMRVTIAVAIACMVGLIVIAFAVLRSMQRLVAELVAMSAQINSAASQMSATANQHEQGASEQVSAVEETRRTMATLVATGEQVNAAIDVVLRNAEQTQAKNLGLSEAIAKLSGHTERIGEISESIRDIAHKSDLLALNAALEGTKAGEAGRGFSLVATQMQRLAENVMESVVNIKQLTADIRRASTASVLATEEGTKLAMETTKSAREIRMMMQQYQAGTTQVSGAMDDISQVGQQGALGSRQVLTGSKDLAMLSENLLRTIERFRLEENERI